MDVLVAISSRENINLPYGTDTILHKSTVQQLTNALEYSTEEERELDETDESINSYQELKEKLQFRDDSERGDAE